MEEILLMSIKTKYANQIFKGTKLFEFRRKSIGEKNLNKKIYIYSSEQEKAIIGYMLVDEIICGDVDNILKETGYFNNREIKGYFDGCEKGYALHICETHKFLNPLKLEDIKAKYKNFAVPQFYRYIHIQDSIYKELEKRKTI